VILSAVKEDTKHLKLSISVKREHSWNPFILSLLDGGPFKANETTLLEDAFV
jgi:hypothetical protein